MIHKKYIEIIPESFKFELVFDFDVKREKENLGTKKIDNIWFCSSNYPKTMCECLFATPRKVCPSFSSVF